MTAELIQCGGLTADQYHADPAPEPSLSSSIARVLIEQSPLHAWSQHPRLGGSRPEPTDTLERGSLIHRLLLGVGAELVIVDAPDFRTKAAKEARAEARRTGAVAVCADKFDEAVQVATRLRERALDLGVDLSAGENELAIVWSEAALGGSIRARAMLDHVEGGLIVDVKTTRSAHPDDAAKSVVNYAYDLQRAAYVRALEAARPELAGRVDFAFLFCELEPPYAVQLAQLDGAFRERGERRWAAAANVWRRCLDDGHWPGYERPAYLAAPGWLLAREELSA